MLKDSQAWLCFNCGHVLSSVASEGSHPSEDMKGSQAAVTQEAEPRTAQRRTELEHYLKLKRYAQGLFVWTETKTSRLKLLIVQYVLLCQAHVLFCLFLSQGWLQDRSGKWVKDENVEFDSDEEEPPSLVPTPTSHWEEWRTVGKHRCICTTVVHSEPPVLFETASSNRFVPSINLSLNSMIFHELHA